MIEQVTVWRDSQGKLHNSRVEAMEAEERYKKQKEVNDITTILQRVSQRLGRRPGVLPQTIQEAAQILIAAYPDIKAYYGD